MLATPELCTPDYLDYLREGPHYYYCPTCGMVWREDDPAFREGERQYYRAIRRLNARRRADLIAEGMPEDEARELSYGPLLIPIGDRKTGVLD